MLLSANRVAWSAVVVARVVLEPAVGATSVVATSEVAVASAEVAGAGSVSFFSCSRTGSSLSCHSLLSSGCRFKDRTWLCLRRF